MKKIIILFTTILLFAVSAFAQLNVRVTDKDGNGLAGKELVLYKDDGVRKATGEEVATGETDEDGKFTFEEVEPGAYKIFVKASDDFELYITLNVVLSENEPLSIVLKLAAKDAPTPSAPRPKNHGPNIASGIATTVKHVFSGFLPGGRELAACTNPSISNASRTSLDASKPIFFSYYCTATDPINIERQKVMIKEQVTEKIAAELNALIKIPTSIGITYRECGEPNAFYSNGSIVVCYELIDEFTKTFAKDGLKGSELDRSVENAVTFAFYHELGHALVDVLDLPITGKEEDAVDQLATYIVADGDDADETTALDGAIAFMLMAKNAKGKQTAFWDQHSLGEQRFFSIVCSIYGDAPDKYRSVVTEGLLPKDRAAECIPEWKKVERSWSRLLAPFVKKK